MRCQALTLAALMVALAGGCGRRSEGPPKLLLLCGAGIRPPAEELVAEFERAEGVSIECDFGGSSLILNRARVGRQGDLFMPGDVRYVEMAQEDGLIESSQTACYFVPVLLVRKGNPEAIVSVTDLARPGLAVGLGEPKACAIGKVSRQIIEKAGLDADALQTNVVFQALTVDELGVQVETGHLDAAIVWDATAQAYADGADIVPIPPEENIISTVPIAVLTTSRHPELARRFQAFVISDQGRHILARHGYSTELPELQA